MSIFDRQKNKTPRPTSYRKGSSELEEAGASAKARYPEDKAIIEDFVWNLKAVCRDRRKQALEGTMDAMDAEPRFFLSRDRLTVYACVLPPENGGGPLTLEDFLDDIHYEGIIFGILTDEIPAEFEKGYYHIFPVARGRAPTAGEEGKITELFKRRRHMRLEVQNGSEVDFNEDVPLQPVHKGTAICLIQQPRAGMDGMDVTGTVLPAPEVAEMEVPQGNNVELGQDGQALVAGTDGILYIESERFCIHAQKIINGDLNQFQGTLRVNGNLYVGGNVDGGVHVVVSGDVVIAGRVGQAHVESTVGIVRVQNGIFGTKGRTVLKAESQVQSPVIEHAQVSAGTSVIAETILESDITCNGTVYAMTGRGMIANSTVRAGGSILCLRVGNLSGGRSYFSVGYPPNVAEIKQQLAAELTQVQSVASKLWEAMMTLKKKGSRMSDQEKDILAQLVKQRSLYMEQMESLKTNLYSVNSVLKKPSKGRIRCEELYPFLDVRIGDFSEEIITIEEKCSIHLEGSSILLQDDK